MIGCQNPVFLPFMYTLNGSEGLEPFDLGGDVN